MLKLIPAKSIATLTLASLLLSIALPLSAYAATEISISGNGNATVTINGQTMERSTAAEDKIVIPDQSKNSTDSGKSVTITEKPTATPSPKLTGTSLRIRRTPTPTPMKKVTPTPTKKVTPTPTKTPTPTPITTAASSTDDKKTFIMKAINDYRKSKGLSPVKTDTYTCSFAKIRAQEISKGFNHNGFRDRINSNSLPYPSFSSVTENIAMTSDYKKVVSMWISSPGHAENMRRDTPFVCVESSGNYYAYEGWRP